MNLLCLPRNERILGVISPSKHGLPHRTSGTGCGVHCPHNTVGPSPKEREEAQDRQIESDTSLIGSNEEYS